ncbi:MAG TPA: hypothetical protein VD963_03875, partial [Phycisphaerales bacterium]|nr:hypothetical protein [Phycisphaerales bacterium]
SAMALERIGRGGEIDLHSGGEDNIFPHHECEIAQTCGATGNPVFARLWFHPRFLLVEGEKMSKSKGNFFTPRDLFARGVEPAALRLELIRTHYRSNANFTMQGLADSRRVVERWRRFAEAAGAAPRPGGGVGEGNGGAGARERVLRGFADALDDDLNIAGALAEVNRYVAETEAPGPLDAAVMRALDAVLGVLELERPAEAETEIGVFVGGLAPDGAVVDKLRARAAARAGKDFARADAIRDELLALGYAIKDVAGGKVEVRRA